MKSTPIELEWQPVLQSRIRELNPLIQILIGPRQVGKTTSLVALTKNWPSERTIMSSADERQLLGRLWIEQHWQKARDLRSASRSDVLLILDEIQKIEGWSETVKRLWDEDVRENSRLRVVLSGSSALNIQSGLTESLAGRFEIVPATHFGWPQFHELTGKGFEHFVFFGGYPGALTFIADEARWRAYVTQSIVESILSKDILLLTRVDKPALLRRLFQLGCEFSGQILSYQKAIGHLQDAGNTTTLAHYLTLLDQAFVLSGLQKFERSPFRKRASSPKFQVYNTALMGALGGYTFEEARKRPDIWGRYLESTVGAHLVNRARVEGINVFYWREGKDEVDFVVKKGTRITAIEVKTQVRGKVSGLKRFKEKVPKAHIEVLSEREIPEFLARPVMMG